jgi:Zn-dependent membrane protease YugP
MFLVSLFAAGAQAAAGAIFNKYTNVKSEAGFTAEDTASKILNFNDTEMSIEPQKGRFTDCFDGYNTIKLSEPVYGSSSVTAVSIAAHEAGHAIQKTQGYGLMKVRNTLVPVTNIGSILSMPLVVFSFMLPQYPFLAPLGLLLYSSAFIFSVVTLPVELNASKRAIEHLDSLGILNSSEISVAKKILGAAAMTYVAATLVAFVSLVRILVIVLFGNGTVK